jgi:hypothetical protein
VHNPFLCLQFVVIDWCRTLVELVGDVGTLPCIPRIV